MAYPPGLPEFNPGIGTRPQGNAVVFYAGQLFVIGGDNNGLCWLLAPSVA